MRDPALDRNPGGPELPPAGLARMLRTSGAGVLIAAASTFLFQHWQEGHDVQRYLGLLALTAALPVAGFFCGLRIGESKGARTLLAVAAGLLPAHFCVLGALLYSRFAWGDGPPPMPAYALWTAPGDAAALTVTAGALLVLAPIAWLAFLALARSRAGWLTLACLGVNGLLLVPSRDPTHVAALLAAAVGGLAWLELRIGRERALRTSEGLLARGLLVAAPVLLAARSALHYAVDAPWIAVTCGGLAAAGLAIARSGPASGRWRAPLETLSLAPAAVSALALATAAVDTGAPETLALPIASLAFAGLLLALAPGAGIRTAALRSGAAGVLLGAAALNVAFGGLLATLWCLGVAIPCAGAGLASGRRWLQVAGGLAAAGALGVHLHQAVERYAAAAWVGLAGLGVAAILAASVLERHWPRLAGRRRAPAGRGPGSPNV